VIPRDRAGATPGDVMIFLATLSLAVALLYPAWSGRELRGLVERAVADVEAVASAAHSTRAASGAWPTQVAPGRAPAELLGLSQADGPFGRAEYTLEWTSWSVVDSVEVPDDIIYAPGDAPPPTAGPVLQPVVRTVGGVAVHTGNPTLLAELAERFAPQTSFVLDTTWVLLLPERGTARTRAP